MPVAHTTTIMHNDALEIVSVVITRLHWYVADLLFILLVLGWVAPATQEDELLGAHVLRTLQMLIVFKIEVWIFINSAGLVSGICMSAPNLIIFILHVFYFLWLVIYLIVFDVQQ